MELCRVYGLRKVPFFHKVSYAAGSGKVNNILNQQYNIRRIMDMVCSSSIFQLWNKSPLGCKVLWLGKALCFNSLNQWLSSSSFALGREHLRLSSLVTTGSTLHANGPKFNLWHIMVGLWKCLVCNPGVSLCRQC